MKKLIILVLLAVIGPVSVIDAKIDPEAPEISELFSDKKKETSYQEIINGLYRKINQQPYNHEHYGRLAFVYDYIGDYKGHLWALQQEVAYLSEDVEHKDIYYGNLARAFILNKKWEQGKEWLDKANAINPDNAQNRWHCYDYYLQFEKDYDAAVKELVKIDKLLAPRFDVYYSGYEEAFSLGVNSGEIIAMFKQAVKLDPKNAKTHRVLGASIRNASLKDYEAAMPTVLKHFNKALKLDPHYVPTYISMGNLYLMQEALAGTEGGYQKALVWFDKAQALEPDNVKVAYSFGLLFIRMQDYDKAIEKLEPIWDQGEDDGEIRYYLANAYNGKAYRIYESGTNLEEGIKLIEKAIALDPENGVILSTKAELLYKLGRFEEAYEYIKRGYELKPEHPEIVADVKMIEKALGISESLISKADQ